MANSNAGNTSIPTIRYSPLAIRDGYFPATISSTSRKLLLAEEHFLADEEGRRAERAALDGVLRVLDQLGLHVGVLRARQQFCGIEAGRGQRLGRHFRVVHFLRLDPHVMERGLDIFLEHAFELRRDRRAHQVQRVDGKERIPDIGLDLKALQEALGLQRVEFALVLDAGERFGRRLVVGGLEDAAEQDRHIFEFHAGALFDRRDRLVAEERIGAAEIEQELRMLNSRQSPWMFFAHCGARRAGASTVL